MDLMALNSISYGVYAIGSLDGTRQVGCVVNSVVQIAAQPAVVAVSINRDNYTNGCVDKSGVFSVSVLGEDTKIDTISVLGYSSSKDNNKFEKLEHFDVEGGLPVLNNAVAYMVCKVFDKIDVETHTVFFATVEDAAYLNKATPVMTYSYYHTVLKLKSPKNAPTYRPEEAEEKAPKGDVYVCSICGYEYDDPDIPFEDLPDDWKCPICNAPKSKFHKK